MKISKSEFWFRIVMALLLSFGIGLVIGSTDQVRLAHVESCVAANMSQEECEAIWYVLEEMD